ENSATQPPETHDDEAASSGMRSLPKLTAASAMVARTSWCDDILCRPLQAGEGAKMAIENASAVELPAAADYDEIVQFIETGYINAFHEADFAKLRRLFHE